VSQTKFLGMWSIGDSVGLAGGVTEALMIFRDFPALCYPMTAMAGILRFTSALVQYVCITSNNRRNEWKVKAVMACDGANVHIIVRGPDRQTDWENKKRGISEFGCPF
jgi:hypothetical protein